MRRTCIYALALSAALTANKASASCPTPASVDLYPTAEELPVNLLRAYIYFPRRMGQDDILAHIALLDMTGNEVDGVFLRQSRDLWSPDRTRLTLLLDPGRVKTGLVAHKAMGRALEAGQSYQLVVRGSALDAQGCPLGANTVYEFRAGAPDLDPPHPQSWTLALPKSGTTAPLSIDLGSPHDHVSLAYRLRVHDAAGNTVAGRVNLGPEERIWRFTPSAPWSTGPFRIEVDGQLEDLAGNRPGILFDRPIATPVFDGTTAIDWIPETVD